MQLKTLDYCLQFKFANFLSEIVRFRIEIYWGLFYWKLDNIRERYKCQVSTLTYLKKLVLIEVDCTKSDKS